MKIFLVLILLSSVMFGCAKRNIKQTIDKPSVAASKQVSALSACDCPPTQSNTKNLPIKEFEPSLIEPAKNEQAKVAEYSLLKPAKWEDIDGFLEDDLTGAWGAWLQSCNTLKNKQNINQTAWQTACSAALSLVKPNNAAIIAYLTTYFDVFNATNMDGANTGLITGYYEPLLKGSRKQSAKYLYPLYRQPSDLVSVELADIYPDLKFKRVRGKLAGNKLVPYSTRAEIEASPSPLAGNEIVWINDNIDVFFLQVQGSGLVKLDNGEQIHVGYADQNGHAYNSIGRLLVERGELTADSASMQGIKIWAKANPNKLRDLLNSNPSYVFFRELPAGLLGPLGALGAPITPERSVAIDPKFIPLGAPIFLSTTQPNSLKPLKRLMLAQDTGGAIKGGVRADYFWGAGEAAGKQAGAMRQQGKIWVLLPKGFALNN